jgi:hypothetical protein
VTLSNQVERASSKRPKRGRQTRAGDAELTADIRRLVDTGRPMDTGGSPRSSAASRRPRSRQCQACLRANEEEQALPNRSSAISKSKRRIHRNYL